MRSWATTTIPSWPTRRGCRPTGSRRNSIRETRAKNLADYLDRIDSTVQYSWLLEIARTFHRFPHDRITPRTIGELLDRADHRNDGEAWDREVWSVEPARGRFPDQRVRRPSGGLGHLGVRPVPPADDLVLKLHEAATIERLRSASGVDVQDYASLRTAIGGLFEKFLRHGARACAISLPPDFVPRRATPRRAITPLRKAIHGMDLRPDEREEVRCAVFWMLAEFCADFRLPFDLMIGPIRNVYPAGVAGGRDLFDRRVSLHDYRELFNHFREVTFAVSTLSPDAAAELVAYAWIFPNVLPMGHWWYANIPAFIAPDLRARLQALPKVKLLGYYSDAYKLEFILPKFNMYRRVLADVLADDGIRGRGWSADQALEVARLILVDNPRRVFGGDGRDASSTAGI